MLRYAKRMRNEYYRIQNLRGYWLDAKAAPRVRVVVRDVDSGTGLWLTAQFPRCPQ
jgi:hypothetical protein